MKNIAPDTFTDYLDFDYKKERGGVVEAYGQDCYTLSYLGNQIAAQRPQSKVVLTDGKRKSFGAIIEEKGVPAAVFITAMSSNFPTAVAAALILNRVRIPVILGGIHVSTSPQDVDAYIRSHVPHPELVIRVRGAGDSEVFASICDDLEKNKLKPCYEGRRLMEDGIWGHGNVESIKPASLNLFHNIPLLGRFFGKKIRINATTPNLGCPYACSFCSISTLPPKYRRLSLRSSQDFVDELAECQREGVRRDNRYFFFLPDNLLLAGKRLEAKN